MSGYEDRLFDCEMDSNAIPVIERYDPIMLGCKCDTIITNHTPFSCSTSENALDVKCAENILKDFTFKEIAPSVWSVLKHWGFVDNQIRPAGNAFVTLVTHARGGKSTFISSLFQALQSFDCIPLLVSNAGACSSDNNEEGLVRNLYAQISKSGVSFLEKDKDSEGFSVTDYAKQIQRFRYAASKKVVLLIDSLDWFGEWDAWSPSMWALFRMLHTAEWYILFTQTTGHYDIMFLKRFCGRCPNLQYIGVERCEVSAYAGPLSPIEAAFYGCIPALMHAVSNNGFSVLDNVDVRSVKGLYSCSNLITDVLTGKKKQWGKFFQYCFYFGANHVQWPPCYIQACLLLYQDLVPAVKYISDIYHAVESKYIKSDVKIGSYWEYIVHLAVLLRCLDSLLNNFSGPFDCCDIMECKGCELVIVPKEYSDYAEILKYTLTECGISEANVCSAVPTLPKITKPDVLTPVAPQKRKRLLDNPVKRIKVALPECEKKLIMVLCLSESALADGFLINYCVGSRTVTKIVGYETKSRVCVQDCHDADSLNKIYVLHGRSFKERDDVYQYYDKYERAKLLGFSLQSLLPIE